MTWLGQHLQIFVVCSQRLAPRFVQPGLLVEQVFRRVVLAPLSTPSAVHPELAAPLPRRVAGRARSIVEGPRVGVSCFGGFPLGTDDIFDVRAGKTRNWLGVMLMAEGFDGAAACRLRARLQSTEFRRLIIFNETGNSSPPCCASKPCGVCIVAGCPFSAGEEREHGTGTDRKQDEMTLLRQHCKCGDQRPLFRRGSAQLMVPSAPSGAVESPRVLASISTTSGSPTSVLRR